MLKMKRSGVTLPPLVKKSIKYVKSNIEIVMFILVILALIYFIYKQTEGLEDDLLNEKSIKSLLATEEDEDEEEDEEEAEEETEGFQNKLRPSVLNVPVPANALPEPFSTDQYASI